jgi:hypothetical protein
MATIQCITHTLSITTAAPSSNADQPPTTFATPPTMLLLVLMLVREREVAERVRRESERVGEWCKKEIFKSYFIHGREKD